MSSQLRSMRRARERARPPDLNVSVGDHVVTHEYPDVDLNLIVLVLAASRLPWIATVQEPHLHPMPSHQLAPFSAVEGR
jgi:hypothetical protein